MEKTYYPVSLIPTSRRKQLILVIGFLPGFLLFFLMITTSSSKVVIQYVDFEESENTIPYQKETSSISEFTIPTKNSSSFTTKMSSFPWNVFHNAANQNDTSLIQLYSDLLLNTILIPFVTKEPIEPINATCSAPLLPETSQISNCSPLLNPRKIAVLLNFGFDVDALEIHLNELDSIADKFFLVEGTRIHNQYLGSKSSIWDLVKYQPRFYHFRNKVVHFVVDDADLAEVNQKKDKHPNIWNREYTQAKLRLRKFFEWNNATGYFDNNDLIGIGDTDEIPSREAIHFMKHCEIDKSGAVDIGIWFPFPYDDTIFRTDWPVPKHRYTLGDPTYWTLDAASNLFTQQKNSSALGRRAGKGKVYLLGGMHFSAYPYLPFQLIKLLTGTERQLQGIKLAIDIGMMYLSKDGNMSDEVNVKDAAVKKLEEKLIKGISNRSKDLEWFRKKEGDKELKAVVKPPWFYQCNPKRYISFKRNRTDMRLSIA